jgi:putative tryptophan/tyrosine transport system substrate-binding protein
MGRPMLDVRRREFITLLGGSAAAAWPIAAGAQQAERMRRIGVLMSVASNGPEGQARLAAFTNRLAQLGWTDGRNVRIDYRWGAGDAERSRKYAAELIALDPDVILASGDPVMAMRQATRTIPIVFTIIADPVGNGLVESLAHPGGNATGFMSYEHGFGAKWLELLKQVAPNISRVAVLRDPANSAGIGQFGAIQGAAPLVGVEVSPIGVDDVEQIERGITAFARAPNGGLIVLAQPRTLVHRGSIIKFATEHQLPAVYNSRLFTVGGGLISYGGNILDQYRGAAEYVDRILKGAKPTDLPVQQPTKFELVINLRTAKTLGLTVPDTLLVRADEVIE